jgi:hypothetical protein
MMMPELLERKCWSRNLSVVNKLKKIGLVFCFCAAAFFHAEILSAQPGDSVELNGDTVEYSLDGNVVIVRGNAVIVYQGARLLADQVEFSRDSKIALAEGNVRLVSEQGEISGDKLKFNFETMAGDFNGAKIYSAPYYGGGRKISKVGENEIEMRDAFVTTCDHDKPHYKLFSPRISIYPKDKIVARGTKMVLGNAPVLYIPKFTQRLDEKKPRFTFTPGYDKDWGMFVLTQWRYYFHENFRGTLHFDARERKDIASGVDADYKTDNYGSGVIRTYYMNERSITSKRFFEKRPSPTVERERFKAEWRHKWQVDDQTNAILQYYKLSDNGILKDYFEREYEKDSSPDTYFLLTRSLPLGTFSFRTDKRVNRFESGVERLPELRYDLANAEIANTNLFLKNITTFSNLSAKEASPTEVRKETMRLDVDNEVSYPFKLGIFELRPYVGGEHTYYSKTIDPEKYDSIRGLFRTGASLSTKFYKLMDWETDAWGLDIHKLRHIITPSVSYNYISRPTISAAELDNFDVIDTRTNGHALTFGIENKLQTKRNNETVELLRALLSTDFFLKDDPGQGGFNLINADIDFKPSKWITFYLDSEYDTRAEQLNEANFDLYLNGDNNKWTFGLGKRFNDGADDEITTQFTYKINHKWAFRLYERFAVDGGGLEEQEYTLRRDLHEWTMDLNLNDKKAEGTEIWVIFTLKAFPDLMVDFGTSFNRRKAGSQEPSE